MNPVSQRSATFAPRPCADTSPTVLYIHVVGFFAVIITMAVCTDQKHDAKYVFTHFENNTGWEQDGIAWCISLLPALYAFFSLDTAAHYSEEITNAAVAVPRASEYPSLSAG